ncbi:hypothetical protein ACWCPT_05780 [Streptomyces sp. NPDC002308]
MPAPKNLLSVVTSSTPKLKSLRSGTLVTGGFTLISAGSWSAFGAGVGLITGGVLAVVLQWWCDSD